MRQLGAHFCFRLRSDNSCHHGANFQLRTNMVRSSGSDNVDHHGPVFHFCPTWAEVPDAKTVTIMVTINFWSSLPEVNYRKSPQLGNLFDNSCLLENGVQLGHNFTSGHDGQKLTINEPSEIVANLATINFRTSCPEVAPLQFVINLITS